MTAASAREPLWRRFPAAHQILRARLMDEIFPLAPGIAAWVEADSGGGLLVSVGWPDAPFACQERFSAEELQQTYGRWAQWARGCALLLAERPPA
ncbi:MAG TPA: hypothetical protein VKV26_04345 [Dehalococcoidia bacterium]|nr:hypothetical protein [Dehalococcoidia bacterium]